MLQYLLILMAALLITAIGFGYHIHFFSICYGFSVAGIAALMCLLFIRRLNPLTFCILFLLILYGGRLGGFLLYRETKISSYHDKIFAEIKADAEVPFSEKYLLWVSCSLLYTLQTCPLLFRFLNTSLDPAKLDVPAIIGFILMFAGAAMEVVADLQKTNAKKTAPNRFVSTGLYAFVRCPNYLGELLLWTGVLVTGFGAVRGILWLPALIGYVAIVYVMFSGARRLELRQKRTYGSDPAYQAYVLKVPILLPFIPLYSVEKYTFLKA